MTVAHHAGEQVLIAALAGGATVVGGIAVVARVNLDRFVRWLSRR